jgi:hypothetical protein
MQGRFLLKKYRGKLLEAGDLEKGWIGILS